MANHTSAPTAHEQLAAAVDTLAQSIEAFVLGTPTEPDRTFLRNVDRLEQTIDRLAHEGNSEPERGLDRAVDTLADTIGALVHPSHGTLPPDPDRGLVLHTLAHAMDQLVHIGDPPAATGAVPAVQSGSLLAGIDLLSDTVMSLSDLVLVSPGPCRELAGTIDVLAHELRSGAAGTLDQTLGALAHTAAILADPSDPGRTGDAIRSLADTVDSLAHAGVIPPTEPDRALVHSADALTHDIFIWFVPAVQTNPHEPERVLDRGIQDLAHTIDAIAHTLPLEDPAEDMAHVAAIDAAVHAVDVALRGPGAHPDLIPAVQSLARAVGGIVPCIVPAPEHGIDLALDTLAHTLDFVAHEDVPAVQDQPLLGGLDTLVHAVDALVGHAPIETLPGGALDVLLH